MAKRCGPNRSICGMSQGIYNPFFQNGNYWYGSGGSDPDVQFFGMPDLMPQSMATPLQAFITGCQADGNWALLHDFVYLGLNTAANGKIGWKGLFNANPTNADWNPYSDYQARQSGQGTIIRSGVIPSAIGSLNNFGFGVFIKDHRVTNSSIFGTIDASGRRLHITEASGTQLTFGINSTSFSAETAETTFSNYTHYAVERTASNQSCIVKNGVKFANKTAASTAMADTEIYISSLNQAGTQVSADHGSRTRCYYAYQPVGFNVAAFHARLTTLNQAIDDLIPYITVVYETLGQSNSTGQAENNRRAALTSYTTDPPAMIFTKARNMTLNGSWDHMRIGVNNQGGSGTPQTNHGFEGYLTKMLYDKNPRASVRIIKTGVGGTPLGVNAGGQDWMPPPTSVNDLFDISTIAMFADGISKLQTEYPGKEIKVFITSQQGEADALDGTRTANYGANFSIFEPALRASHALLASAPWLDHKIDFNRSANEATINAAKVTFSATAQNYYLLDVSAALSPSPARKIDLPADVKAAYPPTSGDDPHNNYLFHLKKSEMDFAKLEEIGFFD